MDEKSGVENPKGRVKIQTTQECLIQKPIASKPVFLWTRKMGKKDTMYILSLMRAFHFFKPS